MEKELPSFEYHPAPLATGAIVARPIECVCCGNQRPFAYVGPIYTTRDDAHERVCPWCIESGLAAELLDAQFMDDRILLSSGISQEVVEQVARRTPGFVSWQGQTWEMHCGDAAAFLGDASVQDLISITEVELSPLLNACRIDREEWREITENYMPGGDPSVYKFSCRKCGIRLFALDCG